jgi:ATP-dependent helicase HrpB
VSLPIDAVLGEIQGKLRAATSLVVEAPPGSGKTTRVPPALLDVVEGEILVLEPRRLAARLAARWVARELGENVGQTVGYQVRFEDVSGPSTRIRFLTEGLLLRRMLGDPALRGVGAVVLDEFHERHLQGDLGLALLRRLQLTRGSEMTRGSALRLVVMSATLDAQPIAGFLGGAETVRTEGRRFDVAIEHQATPSEAPLGEQVAAAVRRLVKEGPPGDILVFLPGAAEIHRAREAIEPRGLPVDIAVLHGDLPAAEQDRAVTPGERPKVILATNVAESSVTVPGVVAVVDSGLARMAGHSPWSGLPTLTLARISQASAAQRAGRAGRTRPGRCLRLYTQHDHDTRPAHDLPEVRRADLAEPMLTLHGLHAADLAWLDAPEPAAREAAESLLARLGATAGGALTAIGRQMLQLPVHPRLARLVVEGAAHGVLREACAAAAALGERDTSRRPDERAAKVHGPSDVWEMLDRPNLERVRRQLERAARDLPRKPGKGDPERRLARALLAAFPDRVGKRRRSDHPEVVLSAGGAADLAPTSIVQEATWLVALDVEDRRTGIHRKALIRQAAAIDPDWLLDHVSEERAVEWNTNATRIEVVVRLRYDALTLDEERRAPGPEDADAVVRLLTKGDLSQLVDADAWARLRARLDFLARTFPESGLAPPTDEDLRAAAADLCRDLGVSSLAALRDADPLAALRARLTPAHRELLADAAPERVTLSRGRAVRVEYDGETPWIASRLQDFFGMTRTPTIARGRVRLVLHLLAPNQRAVQVTSDLDGFWDRHYPALRKELGRRYPKHAWPENPRSSNHSN